MSNNAEKKFVYSSSISDGDVDLKSILDFSLRNKALISKVTIIFLLFFSIISFFIPKRWQGKFQIVIDSEADKISRNLPISLSQGPNKQLSTEVGILESPSVLMPIYEFVKKEKQLEDDNLDFESWKEESLKVRLKAGTSILNIVYEDYDRDIIIPVLEKISKTYQEYTGKIKKRSLKLTKNFLQDQIKIYKKKSDISLRKAQEYGMDNDLSQFQFLEIETNNNNISFNENDLLIKSSQINNIDTSPKNIIRNKSIELERVNTVNKIREIDLKLKKLKEIKDNYQLIAFISNIYVNSSDSLGSINFKLLGSDLEKVNSTQNQIIYLKTRFKQNDKSITDLQKILFPLLNQLKIKTIQYLEVQKINLESKLISLERPKEVLLKYNELLREANRDEKILYQFEDKLRVINIENAVINEPWKLITIPTLSNKPISTSKKAVALVGVLVGLFVSYSYAFIKEKRSNYIYSYKEILNYSITKEFITLNTSVNFKQELDIFLKEIIKNNMIENLYLLSLQKINELMKQQLIDFIENNRSIQPLEFIEDIKDQVDIIVIIEIGKIKRNQFEIFLKRVNLANAKIVGLIFI